MKIEKIEVTTFKSTSKKVNDTDGHTHPGPEHDTTEALLTIIDDEGNSGYSFGSPEALRPYIVENFFKKSLHGRRPAGS